MYLIELFHFPFNLESYNRIRSSALGHCTKKNDQSNRNIASYIVWLILLSAREVELRRICGNPHARRCRERNACGDMRRRAAVAAFGDTKEGTDDDHGRREQAVRVCVWGGPNSKVLGGLHFALDCCFSLYDSCLQGTLLHSSCTVGQ